MNNKSIGVFDSGVGGLTVLEKLHEALPNEHFIYIGDNIHSPYGEKTAEQLYHYASEIIDYFISCEVKLIVLACNTTSCTILERLKTKYSFLPMVGVIDATVAMVKANHPQKVAIMATKATIASRAYQEKIGLSQSLGIACPNLVPMIENGTTKQALIAELHQLLDGRLEGCEGIVLGCTHYPIIASEIHQLYPQVPLYSSSVAVVHEVQAYLKQHHLEAYHQNKTNLIYTTGDLEAFRKSASHFFSGQNYIFKKLDLKVA